VVGSLDFARDDNEKWRLSPSQTFLVPQGILTYRVFPS
jgi:hypothetical protein